MKQKLLSLLLTFALLLSLAAPVQAASKTELQTAIDKTAAYLLQTVTAPQVASVGGEWAVIALARSGHTVPQRWWDGYYAAVEKTVKSCQGILHARKYTEYARVVLALTAIGADPKNVAGYDLLSPLEDYDKVVWQGTNGPAWALIALDAGGYRSAVRQRYVEKLLSLQGSSGGWALTANAAADADVTGMVLQALAKYQQQPAVKAATDKALAWLSGQKMFASSESVVQVMVALCELGLSPDDARFVKNGKTLFDTLMTYRLSNGSFQHTMDGKANLMATEQALYAMAAAMRFVSGKNSLYRMDDTAISVTGGAGLPGKHAHVKKVPVTKAGVSFSDTNSTAVLALASRGIITGMGDGTFAPNATMTRAQFAAIIVRALGLPQAVSENFRDVKKTDWFQSYVGTAHAYGIVSGRSETKFDPGGTITRQEAAVMTARAAKLCGLKTAMDTAAVRNMLAQFGDYRSVAAWAQESVAFCYGEKILNQGDRNIEPGRAILRREIADMVYALLDGAGLL